MLKKRVSNLIRYLGLLQQVDWLRFQVERIKQGPKNKKFTKNHPNVPIPPDYLLYESFRLDYEKYYFGGKRSAQWLTQHLEKHLDLNKKDILDWGCGPGRIIRHLPQIIGNHCNFFGTDYNEQSIHWCKANLPNITFHHNSLNATLPYKNRSMDVIYGISIFTHLSKQQHLDWFAELYRVLRPNGIMLFTTHGDNYKQKLTTAEQIKFEAGNLIERGNVTEGHRTYTAFQPPAFMKQLFKQAKVLEHITTQPKTSNWLPQDVWILAK